MAIVCTRVFALPPRLAAMIPWRRTRKRSSVMPSSRPMITMVTHQGKQATGSTRPISAAPVSALSAMGSASVPNAVTSPRDRASSPSNRSVIAATANTPVAA